MSSLFDRTNGPLPYFNIKEDVMVTAPIFSYGHGAAKPGAEFLSGSGARMSGLFSMNMVEVSPPIGGGYWTIPREGNLFKILPYPETGTAPCSTSYETIYRINHSTADRFPVGSVITFLFPDCGDCIPCVAIGNGSYIKLLGETNFNPSPSVMHNSLTLVSTG